MSETPQPATVAVHAGRPPHEADRPLNEPLTMASTFVALGDREYGRYGNPTWEAFEDALGRLEGGTALAFSSGLAAVATVLDLVEGADVLVEGMRPGVLERLGLGPEQCHERNPALVYGRMTGWGQDGPLATAAGHDMNYIAITGALHGLGQDLSLIHI